MKLRILFCMQSFSVFQVVLSTLLFQIYSTAPIISSVTSYNKFLEDIKRDKCIFPNGVVLPFESSSDTFEYFATPLSICNTPESSKPRKEAITLCTAVFDTLKNVTCHNDKNLSLQEIHIDFSENVCADINTLQFSSNQESFVKHLNDTLICEMICDEDYKQACQVLLWSYLVQRKIEEQTQVVSLSKNAPLMIHNMETNTVVNQGKQEGKVLLSNSSESSVFETKTTNAKKDVETNTSLIISKDENLIQTTIKADDISLSADNKITTVDKLNSNNTENHASEITTDKKILSQSKSVDSKLKINESQIATEKSNDVNVSLSEQTDTSEVLKSGTNQESVKQTVSATENLSPGNEQNKEQQNDEKNSDIRIITPVLDGKIDADKINDDPKFKLKPIEQDTETPNSDVNVEDSKEKPDANKKDMLFESVSTSNSLPVKLDNQMEDKTEITKQLLDSENKIAETNNGKTLPKTTLPNLEKMEGENEIPRPVNNDQNPYNDMESENEYNKLDYDGDDGFFDSSKNKNIGLDEISNAKIPEPAVNQNEMPGKPKNFFSRESDEIAMLPAFPEQEDSHFFFYFLSMVFILMGGYLLFHNKQKILALIVEGRHERRRRSHGVGYKKLDTK